MITIPTLSQLYSGILASLESEMSVTIPLFGKNFLRAMAAVQAAKLKVYYLAIGNLQKNIFIDTAESESIGGTLERFGRIKLGRNPFPATPGSYTVQLTGTTGAVVAAQTTFKSNDDSLSPGKLFILDVEYTLNGTNIITLRALEGGLDSKLSIGDELTSTVPIANVNSLVTVLTESIEPRSAESLENYRLVGINAYQLEPQGGAPSDYRIWAADAQGVRRVYPYPKSGFANEINLFVEATIADSTDGKGTPSAGLLDDVEEVVELDPDTTKPINDRGRRPLGVFQVHYLAVTIKEIDIVITGYVGITVAIQGIIFDAVKAALDDMRPFVSGADVLSERNDTVSINKLIFIIQNAQPTGFFDEIDLQVDAVSVPSYNFINGNIPYLNSITYI